MGWLGFLKGLGGLLAKVFATAGRMVTDEQVHYALGLIRDAAGSVLSNDEKRAMVIKALMDRFHIPESVARFLVELAYQHFKHG